MNQDHRAESSELTELVYYGAGVYGCGSVWVWTEERFAGDYREDVPIRVTTWAPEFYEERPWSSDPEVREVRYHCPSGDCPRVFARQVPLIR